MRRSWIVVPPTMTVRLCPSVRNTTFAGTYVITEADIEAGEKVNTATAASDQTAPVTDVETTPVAEPPLPVGKPGATHSAQHGSGDVDGRRQLIEPSKHDVLHEGKEHAMISAL